MVQVVRHTGWVLYHKAEVVRGMEKAAAKALRKDSYHPCPSHLVVVGCSVWPRRECQREVPHISSHGEGEQREGVSQASRSFEQAQVSLEQTQVSQAPTFSEQREVLQARAPSFFEQREVSVTSSLLHASSPASCGVERREEISDASSLVSCGVEQRRPGKP